MTYDAFKRLVAEKGWTVRQLRSDDAPPTQELLALMDELGLAKYERFVLHYAADPVPALVAALKGFLHADPDVFRDEFAAARAVIAKAEPK